MSTLSHDDLCRLSRAFNEVAHLGDSQDYRINEWLKERIAHALVSSGGAGAEPFATLWRFKSGGDWMLREGTEPFGDPDGIETVDVFTHPAPEPGKLPELETTVTLLIDRLETFGHELEAHDATVSDWWAHVVPAISRVRSALQSQPETGEGGR
jgi:hypothetical protein